MQQLADGLTLAFHRRDSRLVVLVSTFLFILLLLSVQNGASAWQILGFESMPLAKRVALGISTLFDISSTFTASTLILAVLGSLLAGINLSLAYTYVRMRGEIIVRSGLYSGFGLVLAILGVGCAACGTAFLSLVLGFFGFSAMLDILPYQGLEIGYIGLIILSIATYTLARKVGQPGVC